MIAKHLVSLIPVTSLGCLCVMLLVGCSSTGTGSDGKPLIHSQDVPQNVRQAATCLAFNENASKHVFGVQLTMNDYADDAQFWLSQFEAAEPSAAARQQLMSSAVTKMEADFPRRSAAAGVEAFNIGYSTVIGSCDTARKQLEAGNG